MAKDAVFVSNRGSARPDRTISATISSEPPSRILIRPDFATPMPVASQRFFLRGPVSEVLPQRFCLRGPTSEVLSQRFCLRGFTSEVLPQRPTSGMAGKAMTDTRIVCPARHDDAH